LTYMLHENRIRRDGGGLPAALACEGNVRLRIHARGVHAGAFYSG